ncbi:lactate dehydrogenase [Sphingobacterium sp. Mn56C]|uniref:lactate dehydrogenase n=1 Tax=Sphingobacterium sp. Mn56C TaxID=3395261 RepID=UPI003BBEC78A
MKVVAYNIKEFEKELLAKANAKVHELTLISNDLNVSTLHYAMGKDVIIVSSRDLLNSQILDELNHIGVKKVITRSQSIDHIDVKYASQLNIDVANTSLADNTPESIAQQTIKCLNDWIKGEGKYNVKKNNSDFRSKI